MTQPAVRDPERRRFTVTRIIVLMIIVAAGISLFRLRRTPPSVELKDLGPAIVKMVSECRDAVVAHPRSGGAWGTIGLALLSYEFKPKAQTCLREAARLEPQNPRWPYCDGLSLFPDDSKSGIERLKRTVALHADHDAAAKNRLGTILAELGDYEEAESQF